ncbi:hypothetical protein EXS72_00580 [Candidatus Pacearchaeota archaeon]|nr:hypothetical protein [Candidatus Pacearchaeota archaeon]
MKLASKSRFFTGIVILIILIVSYFIKIQTNSGMNYISVSKILSLLIFKNVFLLIIYFAIPIFLIITGIKKIKFI